MNAPSSSSDTEASFACPIPSTSALYKRHPLLPSQRLDFRQAHPRDSLITSLRPSSTNPAFLVNPQSWFPPHPQRSSRSLSPYISHSTRPPQSRSTLKPRVHESRCLSEIAVNLFVAFEDDRCALDHSSRNSASAAEELTTEAGDGFTHLISIRYGSCAKIAQEGSILFSSERSPRVQTLTLLIPYVETREEPISVYDDEPEYNEMDCDGMQEDTTFLTVPQLVALRQFISSSGYTLRSSPDFDEGPEYEMTPPNVPQDVRILITVPRDRRTDAIAAAVSFVAWDLQFQVEDVLESISEDLDVSPVWRDVIGCGTVGFLENAMTL